MRALLIDQIAKVNFQYTFSLANSLKRNDVDIELVIDKKEDMQQCRCKYYNLFITDDKNVGKLKKGFNYITSMLSINKLLKKGSYDVLHSQWVIFSPIDYLFLKKFKRKGIKLIITVHDILPFNKKFYDYFFHKKIYKLADEIIVQADENINRFKELFPQSGNKLHMIPHGHFLDYAQIIDKDAAREYLDIPKDKFVVLFFGHIKKVKGVDVLLKSYAEILKERNDIYLVIAGSVWKADVSIYKKIIEESGIQDKFKADIKYIPDELIKYYYSAADVNALPYLDVYQSGVIQLSYAYYKPPVATKLPAFTQFVREEETGFLADVNDVESLKNAILKAADNRNRLTELGRNGHELVAKVLDWDKIAKRVEEIYEK